MPHIAIPLVTGSPPPLARIRLEVSAVGDARVYRWLL
jgi:hypothetical protein